MAGVTPPPTQETDFRFSGHETFPLRYTWLPKAARMIEDQPTEFEDDEAAMIEMGLGKNMVRALRFWVQATGVAENAAKGFRVTDFGRELLLDGELDSFLEDSQTLWLLHWKLTTNSAQPLFAWDYMFNRWQEPKITKSRAVRDFQLEAELLGRKLSRVTIEQHFDVFLHTYTPTRGRKGDAKEDLLDCPLVQLGLIEETEERGTDPAGKTESVFEFNRAEKPGISPRLFCYCINEFWNNRHPSEKTLIFKRIASEHGSPGQVFKLAEADIRDRLESIQADSEGIFKFEETTASQTLSRLESPDHQQMLTAIYDEQLT